MRGVLLGTDGFGISSLCQLGFLASGAARGPSRFRIGTVTGLSEQTLRIKAGGADGIP